MKVRSFPQNLVLYVVFAVCTPAAADAGPASTEALGFYVTTVFENCVQAVQTHTEPRYSALKDAFVMASLDDPNELQTRTGLRITLHIRGRDNHPCMFIAQNGAEDNREIAKLLRQKLQAARAERDDPALIRGGESWLIRTPEGRNNAARVTLEMVWNDALLVIHFLDESASSPVPAPQVPPPTAPPPQR